MVAVADLKAEQQKLERLTDAELQEGLAVRKWGPDIEPIARDILERRKSQKSMDLNQRGVEATMLLLDSAGGLVGGFIGFAFAYWLARIQRDWDKREQTVGSRLDQITRAKVPLVRILDQIASSYARQAYFNRATEDRIEDQIWGALYTLGDAELIRLLEETRQPLHDYAWATNEPAKVDALKPYLTKLIDRLEILERT